MSSLRGQRTPASDNGAVRAPLASWYVQGFTDGFGDRQLMFDNAETGPLELLRVRSELALLPAFESELHARFEQLSSFSHPSFAVARAVNDLDDGEGLTVVSAHVPGTRLVELFRSTRPQAGMHPASVRWVLTELVSALAELHRQDPTIAHGALGPDRIVITAACHLVVTDYIFGSALGRIRLPADRLWGEFGIIPSPSQEQVAPDQRNDIVQLALLITSLVIGRRVTPGEYPGQMVRLLDEFAAACDRRTPDATPLLRGWLRQALAPGGFQSGGEAELALTLPPALAFTARRETRVRVESPAPPVEDVGSDPARQEPSALLAERTAAAYAEARAAAVSRKTPTLVWVVALMALMALVALVEAVVIAWLIVR
jgi:hypothetical protein